jgi:glycine/D-amino acid oxidase-like deaminating enzyme
VVLGSKFGTGLEGDVATHFRDLEAWTRKNVEVADVAWRWVNEDYDTPDRLPFVGASSQAPGLYIATGFNAWGISNGTAAGILITQQILGKTPAWASITIQTARFRKDSTGAATRNHSCIASTTSSQAVVP